MLCSILTIQILGAEKALFRALKTKHETPKYGLIYHASLVGQSGVKNKGKISRVLAAKCALSIRVDALGEKSEPSVGFDHRVAVESRLRQLEGKPFSSSTTVPQPSKYVKANGTKAYNTEADTTTSTSASAKVCIYKP